MTRRKVSYLQGTTAAKYLLPAEDHRLNRAALWTPSSTPMRPRGGVVPGSSATVVTATAGGVNIAAGHAVVPGTVTGVQGVYECTWDASEFRAAPAASASTYRRILVIARVYDQLNTAAKDDWDLEVVLGNGAASLGAAVAPAVPDNSVVLKSGSVAPDGTVSLSGVFPWTVARGGICPVDPADTTAGVYVGQYRDHPTYGPQRWDGAGWRITGVPAVASGDVGAGTHDGQLRLHPTLGLQKWDAATTAWIPVRSVSAWTQLSITASWAHNVLANGDGISPGAPFPGGVYRRENDRCSLGGIIYTPGGVGAGQIIATVPTGFRPPVTVFLPNYYEQGAAKGAMRIEVSPNGNIYSSWALGAQVYLFLDGLSWPLS